MTSPADSTDKPITDIGNASLVLPEPIPAAPVPGIRTTEFWLTLLATILPFILAVLGEIDARWAVGTATVLNTLYQVLRSALKTHQVKVAATLQ